MTSRQATTCFPGARAAAGAAAGQRYCALITEADLVDLATSAGLQVVETFYADGHEGNLNLYGVFRLRKLSCG